MKRFIHIAIIVATMLYTCPVFAGSSNYKIDNRSNTKVTLVQEMRLDEIYAHIEEAAKWLGYARDGLGDNTFNIKTCREELAKAPGATLRTIGTTEKELHTLLIAGYIAEAKKWWGYAEDRLDDNSQNILYCLEYLEKAGATLDSIGGSKEEVYRLLFDGYMAEANKWWHYFAKSDDGKMEHKFFLEALAKAGKVQELIEADKETDCEPGMRSASEICQHPSETIRYCFIETTSYLR